MNRPLGVNKSLSFLLLSMEWIEALEKAFSSMGFNAYPIAFVTELHNEGDMGYIVNINETNWHLMVS